MIRLETAKCPPDLTPLAFARFCTFFDRPTDQDECWVWKGYKDSKGYGQFSIMRKAYWAHRIAYKVFVGSIPNGLTIGHKPICLNPSCINPAHLALASRSKNTKEGNSRRKGRKRKKK